MSNVSQEIRDAVAAHPKGLTIDQIMESITGKATRANVAAICYQQAHKRTILSDKNAELQTVYKANPDYAPPPPRDESTPTNRASGPKPARRAHKEQPVKKKAKRKHTRRAKKPRTIRRVLENLKTRDADKATAEILALDNLVDASSRLRVTIKEQVTGLDANPELAGAVKHFDRAQQLYDAVRDA